MKTISQELMQTLLSYNPELIEVLKTEVQKNSMILTTAIYKCPITTEGLEQGDIIKGSSLSFAEPDFS